MGNLIRRIKRSLGIHTYFTPVSLYLDAAVPEEYTNVSRERRGYTMRHEPCACWSTRCSNPKGISLCGAR